MAAVVSGLLAKLESVLWGASRDNRAAQAAQPRGVLILICRCASQGIASSGGRACEEPGPSSFAPLAIGLLPASMSGDNSPRLG
jgi:hypothetical protein